MLDVALVTDDLGMADVASQLGVKVMSTLELLKLMLDHCHIDLACAKAVAAYCSEMVDCPAYLGDQFKEIFCVPFDA